MCSRSRSLAELQRLSSEWRPIASVALSHPLIPALRGRESPLTSAIGWDDVFELAEPCLPARRGAGGLLTAPPLLQRGRRSLQLLSAGLGLPQPGQTASDSANGPPSTGGAGRRVRLGHYPMVSLESLHAV